MKDLAVWFSRQAAKAGRVVLLEDALLGGRFAAYAWHRLRYFMARYFLSSVLHLIQVILLFRFFSLRQFQSLLLVQAAAGLASGFWWGSLETMRARVRSLQRARQSHRIPQEIAGRLNLALRLAAMVVLGLAVWLLAPLALGHKIRPFLPADLYLAVILLRLALDLVGRAYHSGVYALRRVFRPLPSILVTELLSFGAVLAFWPWLRLWSIPLAFLVSTLAGQALLYRFTSRAYRQIGLSPWPSGQEKKKSRPKIFSGGEWLAAGSSYALMRLDSVLILGLFRFEKGRVEEAVALALLFFLLGPTVRAGFEWAQLFYFDLKRLETPLHKSIKARFEGNVLRLAACLGLFFWGIASLAGTLFYGRSLGSIYWLLLFFFPVRSILAALQMRSYAEGAYSLLLLSGAFSLAGLAILRWFVPGEGGRLAGAVLTLALSAAVFLLRRGRAGLRPAFRELRCLPDWLAEALRTKKLMTVSALSLASDPNTAAWAHFQFARMLAGRLGRHGAAAMSGLNRIVWFETGRQKLRAGPPWVLAQSAGWAESVRSTGPQPDGKSALQAAVNMGFFGPDLSPEALAKGKPVTAQAVREEFLRLAPEGIVFDPAQPAPLGLRSLAPGERRSVLLEAVSFLSGTNPFPNRSPFHVTAFAEKGSLRLIFLIDRKTAYSRRVRWESLVRRYNLEAALSASS
ncbi:MAG: hypothetical protein WCB96_11475 [Candidatus Aminicenantales bacterium]